MGSDIRRQMPTKDPTKLISTVTLIETKGLGTVNSETVQQRADRIDRDYAKHAGAIDAKFPGSTVLDELNRYGVEGKVLALVTGSLGNCSPDLLVVIDLIAATKTVRALELRIANRDQLFGMHRRFLISSFGLFTTRLWARHIHDRFRDAVLRSSPLLMCPPSPGPRSRDHSGIFLGELSSAPRAAPRLPLRRLNAPCPVTFLFLFRLVPPMGPLKTSVLSLAQLCD